MPLNILRADLTALSVDAIVNTANPRPTYAAGTDGAVYRAAGAEALLAERRKIGDIAPGQTAVTPAFALRAKYIIHTVGPAWNGGNDGELKTLAACYRNSLETAARLKCGSVAFPLISTGVYGFPKDKALQIAVSTISDFLLAHEMSVTLTVFDRESYVLSGKLFSDIQALLNDSEAEEQLQNEYTAMPCSFSVSPDDEDFFLPSNRRHTRGARPSAREATAAESKPAAPCPSPSPAFTPVESLDELLSHTGETFRQCLFRLIDERGLKDSEVYNRANLSRQLFSKIRCGENYKPSKNTVLALAIALRLNLDETRDLLARAGMAFSPSSRFDIIVSFAIRTGHYDINREINPILFDYNEPLLGM